MDIILYIELIALGVGVGLVSGALGVGGGILMVPAFIEFVPGMDSHTAKGSSLFIIIFVALLNAWRLNRGQEDKMLKLAAIIAAGSVVGGYFGGWVTRFMPPKVVLLLFSGLILVIAIQFALAHAPHVEDNKVRKRTLLAVFIGLISGVISGMAGVGGGAIFVPLALTAGIVSNTRVVALSNTVMIATSTAAALAHFQAEQTYSELPYTIGQVCLLLAPFVYLGAQAGAPLGRLLNGYMTLQHRKIIMFTLAVIIAARLVYKALA